jgi:hypothetical protein
MLPTFILRHRVAGLSHLPIKTSTAGAREYAGHSEEQWNRFYVRAIPYKLNINSLLFLLFSLVLHIQCLILQNIQEF